ncbi:MAG: hypothetical protein HWE27_17915 [Gammaproteobacteria bacterium]|nr:hypothetical protein [Gammaproteobacteria bacterium]
MPDEASELTGLCEREPFDYKEIWNVTPEQAEIVSKWTESYLKKNELDLPFLSSGQVSVQYIGFTTDDDKFIYGNVFPNTHLNNQTHIPITTCMRSKSFWAFKYSVKSMKFISLELNN